MRTILKINENWTFLKDMSNIPVNIPEESERVNLPHTWNAKDGQDGGNDYFRGSCCYIKELNKAELPEGEEYFLEINGANNSADVYVNGNNKLKFTFTIAGAETDHPAFNAFYKAAELLNKINFDVTVATDSQALRKLSSGSLAVWAAAWSSTIDPDMYQVYHKDSTATSVLNWGYKQILQNIGGKYNEELALVEELSELIEAGRETTDQNARARIYAKALDIVMQLAIELPTYQRDDLFAYNINKIDQSSLNSDLSPFWKWVILR